MARECYKVISKLNSSSYIYIPTQRVKKNELDWNFVNVIKTAARSTSDVNHSRFMQKSGKESGEEEEEEKDREKGSNKVNKKLREKSRISKSLTKYGHGHYHDHDVYEEEYDEQEPERQSEPDLTFNLRRYKRYVFLH